MKKRHIALIGAVGIAAFTGIFASNTPDPNFTADSYPLREEVVWTNYEGQITTTEYTYNFDWNEDYLTNKVRRIVHLYPTVNNPHRFRSITGHDYDSDGKWDRIFVCGIWEHPVNKETSSCNSVIWDEFRSGWKFKPAPADVGKVSAFNHSTIKFLYSELNAVARGGATDSGNMTRQWRLNELTGRGDVIHKKTHV